jgi:hypothetical protein
MHWLYCWWKGLSGDARAAVIAAIVGPVTVEILGVREKMMRLFYIRTLERLEAAENQIRTDNDKRWPGIIDVDSNGSFFPLAQVATKAGIGLFRAKLAKKWNNRMKKYGG